jgi:replication factor A1
VSEDFKSHIDEILNTIDENSNKDINRENLEKELNKFMEYGVPIDQAKQILIKKYGGIAVLNSIENSMERKLISDLKPNEKSVKLLCRVIAINPKDITVKGNDRKIFYGILGDESGTIQFTAWNSDIEIEKGDVVEILNAYTKEWQGNVQLNLGDRVIINKTDKDKLPESAFKPKEIKAQELRSGIGAVEITVKIVEIKEHEAEVEDIKKKVFSGIIADETGKAQFTSWHDFKLKDGDVIKITGGYVKSWKGIPQLTFDDKANIQKLDKNKILIKDIGFKKMPLFMIIEKRGAIDVEAEGTITEIRPGSGIILRCPKCNRTIINNQCSIHGEVDGKSDLRLKLVIDDGTGSVSCFLNKELTEKLIDKKFDDCRKMDEIELLEEINKKLFSKIISVHGNALGDDFGTSIIARDVKLVNLNIVEEAEKLLKELEDF